jgi:hypothetical protein
MMNQSLGLRMKSAMRVSTFLVRVKDVDGGTNETEIYTNHLPDAAITSTPAKKM